MIQITSQEQFFTLARGEKPVVMIFSADWCPDCRYLDTFIEDVIQEYGDRFDFYKVESDEYADLAATLNVMGIPSFLVYHQGSIVNRFVNRNRKTKKEVEQFLTETLSQLAS